MERSFNDAAYNQFLNEGKIMGVKCKACGALALPPRPICVACLRSEMEWFEFKGTGRLSAFTSIVVAPPAKVREGFGRNNPYIVGVVDLDEGVKSVARIVGVDANRPEDLKIGTPLRAEFAAREENGVRQTTLVFHP